MEPATISWQVATRRPAGSAPLVSSHTAVIGPRRRRRVGDCVWVERLTRRLDRIGAYLTRPPVVDLSGCDLIVVARMVSMPALEAVALLNRTDPLVWGSGRHGRRLTASRLRRDRSVLGEPWVADAVVSGRSRTVRTMSISVFGHSRNRCLLQIHPAKRTPRGVRARQRRLMAAHDVADRLIAATSVVDYTPPDRPSDDPPGFAAFGTTASST